MAMKSDVITIDNREKGFSEALKETQKIAEYMNLNPKEALRLELCAEEVLSMTRGITGEIKASFWIECEGQQIDLHVATTTAMDRDKRSQLLSTATSRKNEAAKSFLGKLRDMFEEAMASEANYNNDLPSDVLDDLANRVIDCSDPEWDGYEQSTLKKLADTIKVGIRGGSVEMTVSKRIAEK